MSQKSKKILTAAVCAVVFSLILSVVFFSLPLVRIAKGLSGREPSVYESQPVTTDDTASVSVPSSDGVLPSEKPSEPADDTADEPVSAPTVQPAYEKNDFDIYRSGKFYAVGQVIDSKGELTPMEIAISDGSVYMLTTVSDMSLGVLVSNGKTYLVYPEQKVYLEMSSAVMSVMGVSSDDLDIGSSMNFADMSPLSEAQSVSDTVLDGKRCKEYVFIDHSGERSSVYMDGTSLLELVTYHSDGTVGTRMIFEYISGDVPEDKISPSSSYEKVGLFKFIKAVTSGF